MRPRVDDTAIKVLLETLPEFEGNYLDLVEIYDEDLTPQVVFNELAEMVSNLLEDEEDEDLLERCFQAVEAVAGTPGVDAVEVVSYSFLEALRPDVRELADSWFGPTTVLLLEDLAAGGAELCDEPLSEADVADMEDLERRGALAPGTAARVVSLAGEPAASLPPR